MHSGCWKRKLNTPGKSKSKKEVMKFFQTGFSQSLRSGDFTEMCILRSWPYEGKKKKKKRFVKTRRSPMNLGGAGWLTVYVISQTSARVTLWQLMENV